MNATRQCCISVLVTAGRRLTRISHQAAKGIERYMISMEIRVRPMIQSILQIAYRGSDWSSCSYTCSSLLYRKYLCREAQGSAEAVKP
jgi:hypothetical protein